jgi:hypothetical protein
MAHKVVFSSDGDLCAYYETVDKGAPKHMLACCKGLRRRITDKLFDPYYNQSEVVKLQRRQAEENGDLLQPGDYGFITKYGDPNKKHYEQMEQAERANFKKKIITQL